MVKCPHPREVEALPLPIFPLPLTLLLPVVLPSALARFCRRAAKLSARETLDAAHSRYLFLGSCVLLLQFVPLQSPFAPSSGQRSKIHGYGPDFVHCVFSTNSTLRHSEWQGSTCTVVTCHRHFWTTPVVPCRPGLAMLLSHTSQLVRACAPIQNDSNSKHQVTSITGKTVLQA